MLTQERFGVYNFWQEVFFAQMYTLVFFGEGAGADCLLIDAFLSGR
jgi:hypothetical protein